RPSLRRRRVNLLPREFPSPLNTFFAHQKSRLSPAQFPVLTPQPVRPHKWSNWKRQPQVLEGEAPRGSGVPERDILVRVPRQNPVFAAAVEISSSVDLPTRFAPSAL